MRGELDINGIFRKMKGCGFTVTTIAANGRRAAQGKCQHRNLWETVEMLRIHNGFFLHRGCLQSRRRGKRTKVWMHEPSLELA